MPAAPLPANDDERLNSLLACAILDTDPDPIFDNITRLAADSLRMPIALVSLVDAERQWFKSARGVEVSETSRDWAFCGYAILQDAPLVITDAAHDSRTYDNPLVTGPPHIRFYAGAQLIASDGHRLGTLCVIDQVSRDLTSAEIETLQALAQQTSALLELSRTSARAEQLAQKAQSANWAKSEFLANMSHEIRTPINAIVGLTELVLQSELDSLQRDYLCTVSESADSLLQVINDILDFSKIEAGKLELERTDFRVRDLVGDVLKLLALKAHAKDLELTYRCDWQVPDVLVGDPGRVRQVLLNLAGNAVKFTESGHVLVDMRVASNSTVDPGTVTLEVHVEDTGIGIAAEKLQSIFNQFEQADSSTTRQFGGTGLGLSITSRLIQKMNGEISVSSQPGRGSTFRFSAQFGLSAQPTTLPWRDAARDLAGVRVLVVDNHLLNLAILQEMIGAHTRQIEVATGGAEALSLLEQAATKGNPYDIVVSDASMPEMDGYALAEEMRRDERLQETPILLLTSSGDRCELQRAQQLNIAGRLLKPVKQAELFKWMARALGLAEAEQSAAEDPRQDRNAVAKPLRVLLAEDSIPNQKLALAVLRAAGHETVVATTGREAVRTSAAQDFDVVLMDIQMPEMDGYQATAAIRARDVTRGCHTPIVAMTAHALTGDREKCLAASMDGYVSKPVRSEELFAAIERALDHRGEDAAKAQLTFKAPVEIPWDKLLQEVGGDRETLAEIVAAYVEEIGEVVPRISRAVDSEDAVQLCKSAHKLKSAMRYFEQADAAELAQQLENHGARADLAGAAADWATLRETVESLQPTLAAGTPPASAV